MPEPPTPAVRARMQATGQRDTPAEIAIRRLLHNRGHRYRVDFKPVPHLRSKADIVFTRSKLAVYVDGCFWHGCPIHGTYPTKNRDFWCEKIQANRSRDERVTSALLAAGWKVVRIWEHEEAYVAVERVEEALRRLTR